MSGEGSKNNGQVMFSNDEVQLLFLLIHFMQHLGSHCDPFLVLSLVLGLKLEISSLLHTIYVCFLKAIYVCVSSFSKYFPLYVEDVMKICSKFRSWLQDIFFNSFSDELFLSQLILFFVSNTFQSKCVSSLDIFHKGRERERH